MGGYLLARLAVVAAAQIISKLMNNHGPAHDCASAKSLQNDIVNVVVLVDVSMHSRQVCVTTHAFIQ